MDKQDELFVVVDKKDRIIGYRSRFDCHHNKKLIHRAIGVVIFNNNKDHVLLQKRSRYKDLYPGLYTISASGHVGKGETYLQSAKRELLEELGIQIPLTRHKKYITESEQETEMDSLFTGKYEGPFQPNKHEVDEVKFVEVKNLPNMLSKLTPFAILSLKQLNLFCETKQSHGLL